MDKTYNWIKTEIATSQSDKCKLSFNKTDFKKNWLTYIVSWGCTALAESVKMYMLIWKNTNRCEHGPQEVDKIKVWGQCSQGKKKGDKKDRWVFLIVLITADSKATRQTAKPPPDCDTMLWWPVVRKPPPSPLTSLLSRKPKVLFPFWLLVHSEIRWEWWHLFLGDAVHFLVNEFVTASDSVIGSHRWHDAKTTELPHLSRRMTQDMNKSMDAYKT